MVPRLDREVTERGLARSRTVAAVRIKEGRVRVNGAVAVKPSVVVGPEDEITLDAAAGDEYVSRAGHKLVGALEAFPVSRAVNNVQNNGPGLVEPGHVASQPGSGRSPTGTSFWSGWVGRR